MEFTFRNVNEAFVGLVSGIVSKQIPVSNRNSRNGPVAQIPGPVCVTYTHPQERVLFNANRDANPFFHLFEGLWMLAGSNLVAPLKYYVSTIGDYSDDGKTFHGAYGHRWKNARGHSWDQLKMIVQELKEDPESRRCVLQMWDTSLDLGKRIQTKDKPCNTHAYFSVCDKRLDMTVCNRSNDMIWGMLGANVVHLSFLQEYLANCIGVEIGVYHQFTNNLHVYLDKFRPDLWLKDQINRTMHSPPILSYDTVKVLQTPLVQSQEQFDRECGIIASSIDHSFEEPFLKTVAQPMLAAFRAHRQRRYAGCNNALSLMERVWADDWREAGKAWILRRMEKWFEKSKGTSDVL